MNKKLPNPPVESSPLTPEEFHAARQAEEAKERERLRKLREEWNAHDADVRVKSAARK